MVGGVNTGAVRTVAESLAAEAVAFSFEDLPPDVVHHAKRSLLDGVGIGIGGYPSEPSRIIQTLIGEVGGRAEATIFVSGVKTSCLYASLANGVMVRYLDYMDRVFMKKEGGRQHTGHHGECIAPILAVSEREHASGKQVITAIVMAYELLAKVADSVGGNHGLDDNGWQPESMRTPCVMALVAGKLLGLNESQMANALAIAVCFSPGELGILSTKEEEISMARNLRFPYGAYSGIVGALMAQQGFLGPLNVFEGRDGIAEVVARGHIDLEKLRQPRRDWAILNTWVKNFSSDGNMHGHLEGAITLLRRHDLRAEDVAKVTIKLNAHTYGHMANAATRRSFRTKYTADHSSYYTTAVAILDRAVGPEQFTEERLQDPRVQQLSEKIVATVEPKLDEFSSAAIVEITTTSGEQHTVEVLRPKGHPMNPLTDADLEHKFRSLARHFMSDGRMGEIVGTVNDLDRVEDISQLTKLLSADVGSAPTAR